MQREGSSDEDVFFYPERMESNENNNNVNNKNANNNNVNNNNVNNTYYAQLNSNIYSPFDVNN